LHTGQFIFNLKSYNCEDIGLPMEESFSKPIKQIQ
jgi:hypothetical protein